MTLSKEGVMMENNIKLNIKILGVINITVGLFCIILYGIPFFASVLGGWVGDLSIKSDLHQALLYFIWRLAVAIVFISAFFLLRSGILIVRFDQKGRKTAVLFGLFVTLGFILDFLSSLIENILLGTRLFSGFNAFSLMQVITAIGLVIGLVYLNSQDVKAKFNDESIGIPLHKPIFMIIIAYIFPAFLFVLGWFISIGGCVVKEKW